MMLCSIDIVLISQYTIILIISAAITNLVKHFVYIHCIAHHDLPYRHPRTWDARKLHSPRETLITLRIIVL